MSELDKNELRAMESFFGSLAKSVLGTLSTDLGSAASKGCKLSVSKILPVQNAADLKNSSPTVKRLKYKMYNSTNPLLLFIPKELIATLGDILTGGDGTSVDPDNLPEVQVNIYNGLVSSVFKNIEYAFRDIYDEGLSVTPDDATILDSDDKYDDYFNNKSLNVAATYELILGKKQYDVTIAFNKEAAVKNFKALGILQEELDFSKLDFSNIKRISDVKVMLSVELGNTRIPLKRLLEIDKGSVLELDAVANSDVSVYANSVEVAKAQIVAVEDSFGIKITKILSVQEGG